MNKFPEKIRLELEKPFYIGSVQKLYEVHDHPELLISETTAGGSVFDVGTIFSIEGSDVGRASFRHLVFQKLQDPTAWNTLSKRLLERVYFIKNDDTGLAEGVISDFARNGAPTHHAGMIERETGSVFTEGFPDKPSNLTLIKKYEVAKPDLKRLFGWHFYDYEKYHHMDGYVIPLEYIVRLGITSGSSILKKYNSVSETQKRDYLSDLGIAQPLSAWMELEHPIVDLTTKYEPEDRNISRQEAALISGTDGDTFSRSMVMAILGAYMVQQIFSEMGLTLWDLKWEIAREENNLVFVDTIDTDSVRVTYNIIHNNKSYFIHFNKQAMRDYYKIMHPEWYNSINDAKTIAAKTGRPFTEVLADGQSKGRYPGNPAVDRQFIDIQKEKFMMIQSFIKDQKQDLKTQAKRIADEELSYYFKAGKKKEYEMLNTV